MRKSAFVVQVALGVVFLSLLTISLAGCGTKGAVTPTTYVVPISITVTPTQNFSMEQGTVEMFTSTVTGPTKSTVTEPVSYVSSNTAVVSIASNGDACAGSWNSLSNPQICTPGPVGVAQVWATAQGVSSPVTTVYVHQHIDKIVVNQFELQNQPPPAHPCFSVGQVDHYRATAYSRGVNITSTVGIFNWQAVNIEVATLSTAMTTGDGLLAGDLTVTASVPGVTPIFATLSGTDSVPVNFTTCAVQSIRILVDGNSSNDIVFSTPETANATTTVIDTLGNTISGVPLTWSTSQLASVTATNGALAGPASGAATVIASCTPPTCNIGFLPSLPIYPQNVVSMFVHSTSNTESGTVYVSSTGCGTIDNCVSTIVPITTGTSNTVGSAIDLPVTPNSLVFSPKGDKAYLGTTYGHLGTMGLTVFSAGSTATPPDFPSTPGQVLAVSPDGNSVVVSDTADQPNQVYIFDATSSTSTAYSITGATAASFSPDSLKAYILAGSTLYVYSKLDAMRVFQLSSPANAVTFLSEGAFAYVAGGTPSGVMVRRTCDNGLADTVATPATPSFIQTLLDGTHVIAIAPPLIDVITANTGPDGPSGCTPGITDSVVSYNLGHGTFTAKQVIVSEDGSTVYIIAANPSPSAILIFNVAALTTSAIPLTGNALPVQMTLTPDNTTLYVAASDRTVHVLNTVNGTDVQQITFPQNFCLNSAGQPEPFTCAPDLIAVKP